MLSDIFKSILKESKPSSVEMVSTDFLWSIRDFDRETEGLQGPEYLDNLTKDIAENGIQSPVGIYFYFETGRLILGEGNHRLAAARRLGIKEIPAYVHVVRKTSSRKGKKWPIPDNIEWKYTFELPPSRLGIK